MSYARTATIDTKEKLEQYYRSLLPRLQQEAWYCGYGLGVHGSMRRDLDLIAIPWRSDARTEHFLAHRLMKKAGGMGWPVSYIKTQWEKKPHGRIAIALPLVHHPDCHIMGKEVGNVVDSAEGKLREIHGMYLDLSVMRKTKV